MLRYLWSSPAGAAGVLYVWDEDGEFRFLNMTYGPPGGISEGSGCPAPLCITATNVEEANWVGGGAAERGYFYHNALRKALVYNLDGGEAIYGECGFLFRLYERSGDGAWFYVLDASLNYDPPMEPGYYARLLLAPPIASLAVAAAIYLSGRARGVRRA